MTRPLLLASGVAWLAVFVATPHAQRPTPSTITRNPHADEGLFTHSDNCVACHNSLVSPTGDDVSIGTNWRSTMMANSSRDPYWQASVRRETLDHPTQKAAIEDECAACHMPMARRMARAEGRTGGVFEFLPFRGNAAPAHRLASDGVSCTVCHQISNEGLGTRESFNGNFVMRPPRNDGIRDLFGPFQVDAGRRTIMRSVTGYEQVEAPHLRESTLCASCHTLITQALGADGRVIGSLPEQMNFQEWQHSAFYREQQSCQACHMPRIGGPVRVASVLGDYRDGLSRHVFVGGNAFMVRMLNRYRNDLGVEALPNELEATARATTLQLEDNTAQVTIARAAVSAGTLAIDVDVRNLAGHKFPSGYPARRAWLHVTVRDANGGVAFESGAITETGLIRGNDQDAGARGFEPHYTQITQPDEVQIYESVMGTPDGTPTTGLLQATHYLKDNRLLPRGFDKRTAPAEIAVIGGAATDPDFGDGADRVSYQVPIATGSSALTVEVELRYQPIGYRWAQNLAAYDAPEPSRFVGYYNAMSAAASVVVAHATTRVAPAARIP